jgi:hypothetical protein
LIEDFCIISFCDDKSAIPDLNLLWLQIGMPEDHSSLESSVLCNLELVFVYCNKLVLENVTRTLFKVTSGQFVSNSILGPVAKCSIFLPIYNLFLYIMQFNNGIGTAVFTAEKRNC